MQICFCILCELDFRSRTLPGIAQPEAVSIKTRQSGGGEGGHEVSRQWASIVS